MLCYVMLCYVMLCYVMLCYVMFPLISRKNDVDKPTATENTLNNEEYCKKTPIDYAQKAGQNNIRHCAWT